MTPVFCCGFECGAAASVSGSTTHWSALGSGFSFQTSTKRTADRALRLNLSSAQGDKVTLTNGILTGGTWILRFYVRFATLPSRDCAIAFISISDSASLGLGFKQSDSKLYAYTGSVSTPTFGATGASVTTGTWYRVDLKIVIATAGGADTADAKIEGIDVGQATANVTDTTALSPQLGAYAGSGNNLTVDVFFDDFAASQTSGDYPIGAGHVDHFVPTSDGTHNVAGADDFERGNTGTDINNSTTTAFQLVDDVPMKTTAPTADCIAAIAPPNAGDYVELVFGPAPGISTPTAGPRGVEVIVCHHQAATQSGNIRVALNDNGSLDDVLNLTAGGVTTLRYARKHYGDPPSAASTWTATSGNGNFNNARLRFFSNDAAPDQFLDGAMIEAEFADSSGTTTPLSVSGATSPAGAIVNRTNKTLSATVTNAGAVTKQTNKLLAGANTPTGSVAKQIAKAFAGATSPSGALAAFKIAVIAVAGALSPSGALVNRVDKFFAGSSSPTGTPIKQVPRSFAGATTPSGNEKNSAAILFSGSSSPSGALATLKVAILTIAGALSPSGTLAQRVDKFLAGSSSPSGSITKTILQRLTGATSPSGTLATLKVAILTIAGALSPSGTLTQRVDKFLAGSSSPSGSITKTILQRLTGALSPSGMIANVRAIVAIAGTITPVGSLRKQISRILTGAVTAEGTARLNVLTRLTGATSPTGALTNAVSFALQLAGAIAPGGNAWNLVAKFYGGETTPAGTVRKIVSTTFTGAISAIGTLVNLTLGILFKLDLTVSDAAVYSCSVAEAAVTSATATDAAVNSLTLTDSSL